MQRWRERERERESERASAHDREPERASEREREREREAPAPAAQRWGGGGEAGAASCAAAAICITATSTVATTATTHGHHHPAPAPGHCQGTPPLNRRWHSKQHGDGPDDAEEVGSVLVDLGADLLGDLVAGQLAHRLDLFRGHQLEQPLRLIDVGQRRLDHLDQTVGDASTRADDGHGGGARAVRILPPARLLDEQVRAQLVQLGRRERCASKLMERPRHCGIRRQLGDRELGLGSHRHARIATTREAHRWRQPRRRKSTREEQHGT